MKESYLSPTLGKPDFPWKMVYIPAGILALLYASKIVLGYVFIVIACSSGYGLLGLKHPDCI